LITCHDTPPFKSHHHPNSRIAPRPLVRDLLRLSRDAVLTLDRRVDDPVELYVGDRLIARGELQEVEGDTTGQLAVRLTEVANLRGGL
jgi:flagellar motor switch protein FliN